MKKQKGFTLIEVLVYLGLFAILMTGLVATAFSIFESSDRDQTRVLMQGEGDFLIAKINWALTGTKNINEPFRGASGSRLSLEKWINPGIATTVVIELPAKDMVIKRGGNPEVLLNNSNVEIENLLFTHNYESASQENVQVSFTIKAKMLNGMSVSQEFSTIKYVRK
jgi:prepilin-type N-terminal cleavage/methylation domain-containing protein